MSIVTLPANQRAVAPSAQSRMRVGFWGTRSSFSQQVLQQLLATIPVWHVAVPATEQCSPAVAALVDDAADTSGGELRLLTPFVATDIVHLAWQQGTPAFAIRQLHSPDVQSWLATQQLDVVCVACFPWRIPASLLAIPTYGFLNVHPSLLPAYRGPAPIFWQFHAGADEHGVTVHWMDAGFDTGALAAQQRIHWPAGISGAEADHLCAQAGGQLLVETLAQVALGHCPHQPQPPNGSSQPWPQATDFVLSPTWSAQRAFNFMRGTAEWQQPYPIQLEDQQLVLKAALAYDAHQTLNTPLLRKGAEVLIQFQPGVLRAQI
ncbi:MAG: formyltransferase family protein [Caldilineaceae bacterium]